MSKKKRPKINLNQPARPRTGELSQLFASSDDIEQASGLHLIAIRVEAIQPDSEQPRKTFVDDSLQELSESIKQDGVIQPIEVTEVRPGQYVIVHGERRWRAAKLAGLETIPAIVKRQNYDDVTRFVRQLVENMQREDLNDVDRARSLIRLKQLMEEELRQAKAENIQKKEPWGKTITWTKVGERLGMSRQRVSQLTSILKLDEEIQSDIREGAISERDTRIYQRLQPSHQRALHRERQAGTITDDEADHIARVLKETPTLTVAKVIKLMRQPPPPHQENEEALDDFVAVPEVIETERPSYTEGKGENNLVTSKARDNFALLRYIQSHLAQFKLQGHSAEEREEFIRLLRLIQGNVESLLHVLESES